MKTAKDIALEQIPSNRLVQRLVRVTSVSKHDLLRVGRGRIHFIADPEMVEKILKDNDAFTKRNFAIKRLEKTLGKSIFLIDGEARRVTRGAVNSLLTPAGAQKYADTIAEETEAMADRWLAKKGPVDVESETRLLNIRIISRTLFGTPLSGKDVEIISAQVDILLEERPSAWSALMMTLGLSRFANASRPSKQYKASRAEINAILDNIIQQRRKLAEQPDDFLGRLMTIADPQTKRTLSDAEIRDHMLMTIITRPPALSMAFAVQALLRHPDKMRAVETELAAVIGNRPVAGDDYANLGGVRAAFNEAMRLHTPSYALPRLANVAMDFGDGIPVKKGDTIVLDILSIHRGAEYWDEPEAFKPERFIANKASKAYFPFGTGERICLGRNLAMVEGTLCLATIFNRLNITLLQQSAAEDEYTLVARPNGAIRIAVEEKDRKTETVQPSATTSACPFKHP